MSEQFAANFANTLLPEIKYLYESSIEEVRAFDDQNNLGGLSAKEVIRAHFCIVDYFLREGVGNGVGGFGPKNVGLLQSALSRPHISFEGISKWNTVYEKAATLLFGLVMNHPFYDANKRTAYLSTVHYLYSSGYAIAASPKELEDLTVLIARHGLKKFARYRDLKKTSGDAEIEYIAWYFRNHTHPIDRRQYLVTYRELEKILKKYNVVMVNPNNNFIDIMRWEDVAVPRRRFFSKLETQPELRKVCSFGFPGWSKVVGKGRIKYLRTELALMPENGVDSQAFFNDVDDMRVLIDQYEGALRRLAYR